MSGVAGRCPECEAPLKRAGYCHACGWDGDVDQGEEYLDGVDLPDDVGYDEILERERLSSGSASPRSGSAGSGAALVVLVIALGAIALLALIGMKT